ncbi:MAG: zinc ribbon domain-containing protein [Lachnospiraceae bacterium]|nr:zinc ribbon domain-containing protein [Lachnospiraceae bacterium]
MKSIKRGRGPSMMGGISSVFAVFFGVFWMIFAFSIGAGPFALFGLFFIAMAITSAIYNFKNATGKNRYSEYDITEGNEEPDPFNERFNTDSNYWYNYSSDNNQASTQNSTSKFCPYCGTKVETDYEFCNNCGKKLP